TSEAEVEKSPASEAASPEQQTHEHIPEPIPEQIPADPVIQNSPEPDIFAKFENFRTDFSHQ
ncbi:hypothetical protein A2U01_0097431, partial [Trifolium medium]|nr:hypothetical protein [Trifolium medium]